MMETKPIGLYVHIPFCKRKCNYCDFCSESASGEKIDKYTETLIAEIESYKSKNIEVDSVFWGGGTPSYIEPENFHKIAKSIRESFKILPGAEYTAEVNPGTLDREKIRTFKECGINRISVGLQSIHENEMKILGRIHNYDEFIFSYDMIRSDLTDNINVDLMYGIPEQTIKSFVQTLESVIKLSPRHISCYGLIIEPGTPFFDNADNLSLPGEDEECDMYDLAHRMLSDAGYRHYEISNYAKPGFECRHNLKYWHDEEYIGLGLAAHSYYNGKRFSNTENFSEYFDGYGEKYRKVQSKLKGRDPFEYAMLGLRLSDGFLLSEYKKLFGQDFAYGKEELLHRYCNAGYMTVIEDRIALTPKGFYISNSILTSLLDFSS